MSSKFVPTSMDGFTSRQTCREVTILESICKHRATFHLLLLSDVHIDHPHHVETEFKRVMDQAKELGAKVLLNGDTICAMQGRNDKRHNKGSLPQELQRNDYWNALVDYVVERLEPYKDIIAWVGYGNHETAPIKHGEIDVLKLVVDKLNDRGANIQLGSYISWIVVKVNKDKDHSDSVTIRAFHGAGSGGPVTKAMISHQRLVAQTEGADVIWTGHIHEFHVSMWVQNRLNNNKRPVKRNIYAVTTPGFKDEHQDGYGWAIEKGIGPKPLGGAWLSLEWDPGSINLRVKQLCHA